MADGVYWENSLFFLLGCGNVLFLIQNTSKFLFFYKTVYI